MKRAAEFLTATLFLGTFLVITAAQEKPPSPGLAYLLDGAVRIYVIDESRCSAKPDSKEGGRWYLIEGEEILKRLRVELSTLASESKGGCACGGPDIHFYAETAAGETTYFGIDCEVYLAGVEIPKSTQALLIPARPTFVGKRMGQTYVVDLPLGTSENQSRAIFRESGFTLLTSGYWNIETEASPRESVMAWVQRQSAPVHLVIEIGPLVPSKPEPVRPASTDSPEWEAWQKKFDKWFWEGIAEVEQAATKRADRWMDDLGLRLLLVSPPDLRFSGSSGDESTYSLELYLRDPQAVKSALSSRKAKRKDIAVRLEEFRSGPLPAEGQYYQAALLLSETPTPEEIAKVKAVLPGIGRVVPLCECREKPRG